VKLTPEQVKLAALAIFLFVVLKDVPVGDAARAVASLSCGVAQ
jgi:hypothetical protein